MSSNITNTPALTELSKDELRSVEGGFRIRICRIINGFAGPVKLCRTIHIPRFPRFPRFPFPRPF